MQRSKFLRQTYIVPLNLQYLTHTYHSYDMKIKSVGFKTMMVKIE